MTSKTYKKSRSKTKTKGRTNLKNITFYKCGRKSHIQKFCRLNSKLYEIGLDDKVLCKISVLLIESSKSSVPNSLEDEESL